MGLTKQYRRFLPSSHSPFGLIGSGRGGLVSVARKRGQAAHQVVTARAQLASLWDLKTGEKVRDFSSGEQHEVTALAVSPTAGSGKDQLSKLAVGYADGAIRLFDLQTAECEVTLSGHKSAVTSLAFDRGEAGLRLASGARDTHVIVWDVVNECGLYRLKGHKGPVTRVHFLSSRANVLVTSAKDRLVKFWDLDIQHCFSTLAAHMTEVWDFALVKDDRYLVTGTSDSELRVWRLTFNDDVAAADPAAAVEPKLKKLKVTSADDDDDENREEDDEILNNDESQLKVERMGSILRAGQDKVSHMWVDASDRLLVCHGADKTAELFLICSDEEVKKRVAKKARKERRKRKQEDEEGDDDVTTTEPTIQEEFRRLQVVKFGGKVRSLDVSVSREQNQATVTALTANNMVEQFSVDLDDRSGSGEKVRQLEHPGHRSDVRTVAFSSDNTAIVSGSHEAVKIWNRSAEVCVRTIPSGYCLSSLFVPGDRQVVVGTKQGHLQIVDVASAELTEDVPGAHAKEIWSLSLAANKRGFVSASADQTVKFWDFELMTLDEQGERIDESNDADADKPYATRRPRRLSVVHKRTLQLEEDALAVKLSDDGRLIAVSLLDSTVKVFFVDTLKFFLSLYGHKLPALAMDISSDSTLIATGGADKNVKIWGLDFGDCHKSIFAHDDSVTAVQFLPNTHMFFTAGKDGKVKQWDADNFQRIVTLDGHHGEIWSLAVSPNSKFAVTSGHDKTLRLWERSEEVLVLDDERETEREKEGDQELATGEARLIPGEQDKEAGLPTKKTVESERGAERLMEAMELYHAYTADLAENAAESKAAGKQLPLPAMPPLMQAYQSATAEDYMVKMIEMIKSSEIEQTLLVLPFDVVIQLLEILEVLLKQNKSVETMCRMFFFLIEIHYGPLSSASHLAPLIRRVRDVASERLAVVKDCVGFNLAALRYHHHRMDERERALELVEAVDKFKSKKRRKKNKEKARQTAVIAL